jgi:MATE family multidrug resistance protein
MTMGGFAARAAARLGWPADAIATDLATLLRLAGPVVVSRLGIMTMGLTDALVVGRYSATQLSYHALGWAPTAVVVTVCVGLLSGVQVMTSRTVGEGRRHLAGAVLRRGLVYGLAIGAVATLLLALGGPLFLHSVGLGRDLADGASRVLLIFSLSLAPYALSVAATVWLEALSRPLPVVAMMWVANGVNLAIDLVLVPGRFGLPAMGAMGGACATLGARTALAAALLAYIALMPDAKALGVFDKPARDRPAEIEQRRIGFGAGASSFFEVAAFAGMNIVAGWIGPLTVAAYTIVLNAASLVFMVPLGLSTATSVLVGTAYGARDLAGVNRAASLGFAVTTAFGLLVAMVVWPTARLIAGGYTTNPTVIAMGVEGLLLACLFFIPDCLQVVAAQSLRARGEVWLPTATHMVSYGLVMAPLAWFLAIPMHMGLPGILWGIILASLMSAGLLLGRFWMLRGRL